VLWQEPNNGGVRFNFIETGFVSLRNRCRRLSIARHSDGELSMGVGVSRGAVCVATSMHRSTVLCSGGALRIRTGGLQQSMRERLQIREHLRAMFSRLMIHSFAKPRLCGVRHQLEASAWLAGSA